MNLREGMRRLGIVLGIAGGVIGVIFGYDDAAHLWNMHIAHQKFDVLMTSTVLLKVSKDIKAFDTEAWKESLKGPATNHVVVNSDGIKDVTVDKFAQISSVELSTGESIPRIDGPTLTAVMVMFLYPVGGFLIPWGIIRVIVWLGAGFFLK